MSRARPSTRPPKSSVRAVTEPEFVALRERHRAYVRGYFSVREPDAIDELEQELWLQLWRRHDQFRAESSERTWVIGFAENVVKQHRRYRHADELPFTVRPSPRQLRFSEQGIERYIAARSSRARPAASPRT